MANSNIWVEGFDTVDVLASRPFNAPVPVPSTTTLPSTVNSGVVSEASLIQRGGQALANAYETYILDSFMPDAERAAESALRGGANADDVVRQLATYDIEGLRLGAQRAADAVAAAGARIAAAVTFQIPEVLVSAARVATGVPLGLATGIVQGGYYLGSWLSDLAYRNAVRRFTGPDAPPAPPDDRPPRPVALAPVPDPLEEVVVEGRRPPPPAPIVTLPPQLLTPGIEPVFDGFVGSPTPTTQPTEQPRPVPNPVTSPLTNPNLFIDPVMLTPTATPTPTPTPNPLTSAPPLQLTNAPPLPGALTNPFPPNFGDPTRPNRTRDCDCPEPQRKKKRKKKPRTKCYRGTYLERSKSLTKIRREEIPCQ